MRIHSHKIIAASGLFAIIAAGIVYLSMSGFLQVSELPEGTPLGMAAIEPLPAEEGYQYLYFGKNDAVPVEWRMLSTKTSIGGADGVFLLANRGMVFTDFGTDHGWKDSKVKAWCEEFYASQDSFTDTERRLILETSAKETEREDYHYNDGSLYLHCGLDKEHIFVLSVSEAMNPEFGFPETIKTDGSREMQYGKRLCWWWLRSPNSKGDDVCCLVYRDGNITFDQVTRSRVAIRPAMNLSSDKEQVLLAVPCEKYVVQEKNWRDKTQAAAKKALYWKLKLIDDTMEIPQISSAKVRAGKLKLVFDGNKPGLDEGQRLVLLIADKQYEKAYTYEALEDISITPEGKLEMELPSYYHKKQCDIYLLMENAGEGQETDFVSRPVKIL